MLVRSLVSRLVAGLYGPDRLLKTQIVKFLYLIDLEWVKATGQPLTGLRWFFHNCGPWDGAIEAVIYGMSVRGEIETEECVAMDGHAYVLCGEGRPQHIRLPAAAMVADSVLQTYRQYPLRSLLDEVVYQTPPMRAARRGDVLNLLLAGPHEEDLSFLRGGSSWGSDG